MKLQYITGCTIDHINLEGNIITSNNVNEILIHVLNVLTPEDKMSFLRQYIRDNGESESTTEPCETCGDYIDTYTVEIEETKCI